MKKIDVPLERLKLSVSKVKSFADCKKKYKYQYIEKLPSKDWDHLTFGSFVHKILEDFHKFFIENNDSLGLKFNRNIVMNNAWKAAVNEFKPKLTKEIKLEVWDLMKNYLKLLDNNFPNVAFCEKDFDLKFINNVELKGYIDRVDIIDNDTIKVSDYKTSKSDKYLINDPFQLITYAYVLLLENPNVNKIIGSYIMVRDNFSELTFEFTKEEVLDVKNKFLNYSVDIRNESEFLPTPTILCNWCNFIDNCSEGKKMLFNKQLTCGEVEWS